MKSTSFLQALFYVAFNDILQRLKITPKRVLANQELLPADSLLHFAANTYSQSGQDGILTHLRTLLDINCPTFMEFGAWDGEYLSNCRSLLDSSCEGLMVELSPQRFSKLCKLASNYPTLKTSLAKISHTYPFRWSDIYSNYFPGAVPNILSIDIDGFDLEVFLSSSAIPDILIIEGGSAFHPCICSPSPDPSNGYQHPLGYIFRSLLDHGMTPVCFCQDTFAIRTDIIVSTNVVLPTYNAEELFSHYWSSLSVRDQSYVLYKRATDPFVRNFEQSFLSLIERSSFKF